MKEILPSTYRFIGEIIVCSSKLELGLFTLVAAGNPEIELDFAKALSKRALILNPLEKFLLTFADEISQTMGLDLNLFLTRIKLALKERDAIAHGIPIRAKDGHIEFLLPKSSSYHKIEEMYLQDVLTEIDELISLTYEIRRVIWERRKGLIQISAANFGYSILEVGLSLE